MLPLLTASQMRMLDELTIREIGLPGAVLMETAGRGVFEHLWRAFGEQARCGRTAVVCGKGNNGGDGFVVARCLANRGCAVTAYLLGSGRDVRGDAAIHLAAYVAAGGCLVEIGEENRDQVAAEVRDAALVVDAILGTGLSEAVRGLPAEVIQWISTFCRPIVSVDIPSGVSSDTGQICGIAVRADLTVTFGWAKQGHFLSPGASHAGRLEIVDIGISPRSLARVSPQLFALEALDFADLLERRPDAHKGNFGHVFVFGGSAGKEGAAILSAWAALKAGAGLSTVAWPAEVARQGTARLPLEVMNEPLPDAGSVSGEWSAELWDASAAARGQADALVVGPGLGTGEGARAFLNRLLGSEGPPLVLDADALNLLAARAEPWSADGRAAVLTPHPGEAARLLGASTGAVQADRVGAALALARRHGCVVILKGAGTLVAAPDSPPCLVPAGNAGMATAGSGDVLSGVVGALLARGLTPIDAARFAAFAHATAGDLGAAQIGQEGLTATDILRAMPEAYRILGGRGLATTDNEPQTTRNGWEP